MAAENRELSLGRRRDLGTGSASLAGCSFLPSPSFTSGGRGSLVADFLVHSPVSVEGETLTPVLLGWAGGPDRLQFPCHLSWESPCCVFIHHIMYCLEDSALHLGKGVNKTRPWLQGASAVSRRQGGLKAVQHPGMG